MRYAVAGLFVLALAACGTAEPEPQTVAYTPDDDGWFVDCSRPGALQNVPSCRQLVYTLIHPPF